MFYPVDLTSALQSIPWFMELKPNQLGQLVRISKLVEVQIGENLFCEGEKEDYIYIVLEGNLAVEIFVPTRGTVNIFTAEPLDVIGWSSMTPVVRQRTATARAIQFSRLAAIQSKALSQLCEEDHDIGYLIMKRLANIVASRLLTTRIHLLDLLAQSQLEKDTQQSPSH